MRGFPHWLASRSRSPSRRRDRSRAQTAVIGFVLMFGVVMLLMTILQVSAVPAWNQGEEFDHNQQVRDELELLRDDIADAAATGRVTSESVTLGTRYPRRPFLLNPGDPTGSLRTTEEGTVRLTNLTASGETGDYWAGGSHAFRTRHLVYTPNYNEYDSAPRTVYENGVLYDRYGDRRLPLTAERVINGNRITLVTIDGSLSRATTRAVDVELTPVSAPHEVTTVEGEGPVRIELPTRLDEETWNELLADQFVASGGNVYDNVTVNEGDPYDTVTISLRGNQTYSLRLAEVSIASRPGGFDPHYITVESPGEVRVPAGSAERIAVAVRDRYNNAVSGVSVDAAVTSGPGSVQAVDAVTDSDGEAIFRYRATDPGTATVNLTFGGPAAAGELETATVAVDVPATASGGGGDSTGPVVTDVATNLTGDTVQRGAAFDLTATASDFRRGGTDIYAAEWWSNRTAPGGAENAGFGFAPGDGQFDAVEEGIVVSIDTAGWTVGRHELSIRAQDANGTWGPPTTYVVEVTDGGSGTASETTSYVEESATSTNARNRFAFTLDIGGEPVTLRNASVDTTGLDGSARDQLREIRADGDDVRSADGTYVSDGTVQQLDSTTLTGEATIRFGNFDNGDGNSKLPRGPYELKAEADGSIVVTLGFEDGSVKTLYFGPV